jgi:hypothetical protein
MTDTKKDLLVWVAPEFLKSPGMIQLFKEAGIFSPPGDDLDSYREAAEAAGGFALTGKLGEAHHGAGIWIGPIDVPGLELMIPWAFVKSVVTAETTRSSKLFGLITDIAHYNPVNGKTP